MKLTKLLFVKASILAFTFNVTYAQQTPVLADYNFNRILINPSYTGLYQNSELVMSGRTFLNTLEGSPKTANLTYHTSLHNNKVGVGGLITYDNIGVTSKTGIYAAGSYKLILGYGDPRDTWYYPAKTISFGLIGGFNVYREGLLRLNINNDPNFQNDINIITPSIGAGIHYNSKHFFLGLSSPNLLESVFAEDKNIPINTSFYLNSGVRLYSSRFLYFEPSVLLKYVKGAPLQLDMNATMNINRKFELGVGYRTAANANVFAGIYASENLKFIYNFSTGINNSPLGTAHGIIISYLFPK